MGMKMHDPNAERIILRVEASGDIIPVTEIVYTVPAGHIFWLEECDISPWTLAVGFCAMFIRNTLDVTIRGLAAITINSEVGAVVSDHAVFPSFLELPEGWDICVYSDGNGLDAMGTISGFLTSDYA